MMLQLYQPLNFMGMVYRDIKQAIVDIELMFDILEQNPEIQDRPGAPPLVVSRGRGPFRECRVQLRSRRAKSCAAFPSRRRRARRSRSSGRRAPANRRSRACCFASMNPRAGRITIDGQDIGAVTQASLARSDRHGAAGHGAVQRHDPLQHPLRPRRRDRRRGRRRPPSTRRSTRSFARCRKAIAPRSASAASNCRAARSSASRSRAPC